MREVMGEHGIKAPKVDPATKYYNQFATAYEPLSNYMDVSSKIN